MAKQDDREARVFKRRSRIERGQAAHGDAVERRVNKLNHELSVAQLDAVAEDKRPADWQQVRDDAERQVRKADAEIKALEAHAEGLVGKPATAEEKRERTRTVNAARKEQAERNADAWEDALAGHERNIARLEALPENLRDPSHETDLENERKAVETIERALDVQDKMFPGVRERA